VRRLSGGRPVAGRGGWWWFVLVGVLAASGSTMLAPQAVAGQIGGSGDTGRMLRQAAGLEASGDLEGAERVLREVLGREPGATGALMALERVVRMAGRPEAVLPSVEAFLQRNPDAAQVRLLQLRVLAEVDSLAAVRREADEWTRTAPTSDSYREVAGVYESVFGPAEALDLLLGGRAAMGAPEALALEVGDLRMRTGDREGAVREWATGVGDDGAQVASVARRLRELPEPRDEAARTVLSTLTSSPVFARRRAAALLAVELRMEREALSLSQAVSEELGTRARSTFLAEVGDRARDLSLADVAGWAYDELGEEARTPAERRAFDQRLVEVALAAGDTAAAASAQTRIARSFPEGSPDRRRSAVQALRLGAGSMEVGELRAAFAAFTRDFPSAPETDELAATVSLALQVRGDDAGALTVLEGVQGPRSALERGYLLLAAGRVGEGREALSRTLEGLSPSEATGTIRLVALLGRLSADGAATLALAASEAHRGRTDEAIALLSSDRAAATPAERAALLAHAARIAEDSGDRAAASGLRTRLLDAYPDDPSVPEAALALARYHAGQGGDVARAIEILEELIASRPNAAVVPNARAELARLRGTR
jgi:tetratricopeptide (TPR) repeat protein